jgi:phosphoribosylformimino-5-aminoimidazole carboxamide ribonucleotide (ProFAR) isomerase
MQSGPNINAYRGLAQATEAAIIASGGVSTIADIRALAQVPRVEGVIVGRALYEHSFELSRAIATGRGEV